jgi:hypothetical protein
MRALGRLLDPATLPVTPRRGRGAQSHALLTRWAHTISREEVNAAAASLLSYVSHYGNAEAAAAAAVADPDAWAPWGATRATSIVACIPAFTDPSGQSTGAALPGSAAVAHAGAYVLSLSLRCRQAARAHPALAWALGGLAWARRHGRWQSWGFSWLYSVCLVEC